MSAGLLQLITSWLRTTSFETLSSELTMQNELYVPIEIIFFKANLF